MPTNLELLKPKAKRMSVDAFKSLIWSTPEGVHVDKIILSNGQKFEVVPSFDVVKWNAGKNTPRVKHVLREVHILEIIETDKEILKKDHLINEILIQVSKGSTADFDKITFLLLNLKRSLNGK